MSTLAELLVVEVEYINRETGVAAAAERRRLAQQEHQITEALRRRGLTLVKTANGYDVLELGELTAQASGPQQERKPMTDEQAVKCIEAAGFKKWRSAHFRLVKEAERHHGIME